MQFTRRACQAAALLAVATLCAAAPARAVETKFLPNDTEVIISINIQQLLKSEVAKANKELIDLAKFQVQKALEDQGVAKYLEKAGFDLFTDLKTVTVAGPGTKNAEAGIVILQGKFDPEKIQSAAEQANKDAGGGLKVTKIAGQKVYEVTPAGEKTLYVTLLGTKTMVACANKKTMASAIARAGGNEEPTLKKEVRDLLKTVDAKQSVSMIGTGAALGRLIENAPNVPNAEAAGEALKAISGLSLAVTVKKDVNFQLGVNSKDRETAEKVAQGANGGLLMARGMLGKKAKDDARLAPVEEVLKTMRVVTMGNNVLIRGEISFENLGKLLKNLPQAGGN